MNLFVVNLVMAEQAVFEQLRAEVIKAAVIVSADDMDVVVHESIDSTNSWSLRQSKAGKELPFACFAEEQTQGRGRRGKSWKMAASSNIAMSIVWPFSLTGQPLHLLPLSVALAIVKVMESFKLKQVQIKWPNDVYVGGKKIAGILIETLPQKDMSKDRAAIAAVIGVGVNYDMSSIGRDVSQSLPDFTDIVGEIKRQAIDSQPDRTMIASMLLRGIVDMCQNFQENAKQDLEKYRSHYDYCREKNVDLILDDKTVLSGIAQGVNDEAELVVMIDGQKRSFNSAEVSVQAGKGTTS